MKIDAVAFDIDGTLYPNSRMYFMSIPFFVFNLGMLSCFSGVRKEIRTRGEILDFHDVQAEMVASCRGWEKQRAYDTVERIFYTQWEKTFQYVTPFRGVAGVLGRLKGKGLKLGALSDFPVGRKLAYLGLDSYWDVGMSSEDTGYLKPDPRPFLDLAERLDCQPERILYVGNSVKYDVVGASGAGMKTACVIPWFKSRKGIDADIIFKSYAELERKIDQLFA